MTKFQVSFALLILGVVGALTAVVPVKKLGFKTAGATQQGSNGLGIYKGKTTTIKKHPYMVGILYEDDFLCAGTIVSEKYVLLSGDCVYGLVAGDLQVVAGSKDGSEGKKYSVEEVTVHPNYGLTFLDYDFALLKMKDKFKLSSTVKIAKLPKKKAKSGSKLLVAGWGDTAGSDGTMKEGKMKALTNAQCQKLYEDLGLTMTDRMACAYDKGKTTLCDGDWSDPFTEKGVIYQLYIAVGTTGECSSSAGPAINADVFSVKSWIKKTAMIEEDDEDDDEEEDEDDEEEEEDDEEMKEAEEDEEMDEENEEVDD